MIRARPTYNDLAHALRAMVEITDYRDLDKGREIATREGSAKLEARNIVRRLPAEACDGR